MITEATRAARRKGLGGSDIAGIIPCKTTATKTLSPWSTQVDVWNSKIHPEDDTREESEAMWWGSEEEDLVARRFTMLTGKRLVNHNMMIADGCLIANLDRLVIPDGAKIAAYRGEIRTNEIFEAKTASSAWEDCHIVDMLPGGIPIRNGAEGIPPYYQTQLNHYLGRVPTADRAYVGVKFAIPCGRFSRTEYGIYVLERDSDLISEQDAYAREWWERHIVHGERPEPVNEEDCKVLWRFSRKATRMTADRSILGAYLRLKKAKEAKAEAEAEESSAKLILQSAMGENEEIVGPDGDTVLATWKSAKDKVLVTTNWEAVARARGATVDEIASATVTETKPGSRTFLLKTTDKVAEYAKREIARIDAEEQQNNLATSDTAA